MNMRACICCPEGFHREGVRPMNNTNETVRPNSSLRQELALTRNALSNLFHVQAMYLLAPKTYEKDLMFAMREAKKVLGE